MTQQNPGRPAEVSVAPSAPDAMRCPGVPVSESGPRLAALLASALPPSEPLPGVGYVSKGNLLVVGGDERALALAESLSDRLPVTLMLTSRPSAQAALLASAD